MLNLQNDYGNDKIGIKGQKSKKKYGLGSLIGRRRRPMKFINERVKFNQKINDFKSEDFKRHSSSLDYLLILVCSSPQGKIVSIVWNYFFGL